MKNIEWGNKQLPGVSEEELFSWTAKKMGALEGIEAMRKSGKMHSEETKEKRASWHRGRKRSQEFKDACSKRKKGVKIGPVPSKYVPVIATNVKTGEEIKFDGQVLAADKLNLKVCNINSVLKNRQATTGGWTFKYA